MSDISAGTIFIVKMLKERLPLSILQEHNLSEIHFFNPFDQSILGFISDHYDTYNSTPDFLTVSKEFSELKSIKLPEEPIKFFADKVKTKFIRHYLSDGIRELHSGLNNDEDANILIDNLYGLYKVVSENSKMDNDGRTLPLSQVLANSLELAIKRRRKSDEISGVSFGFDFIDKVTDGAQPGDFITVAARPEVGKTHIMLNSFNAAVNQGKHPLFATFEMTAEQLGNRLIERRLGISSMSLRFGQFTSFAEKRIKEHINELIAIEKHKFKPIVYDGGMGATVQALQAEIEKENPGALYVDGAYLLQSSKRGGGATWEVVAEAAKALKALARTKKIPCIASYQLNKQGKGKNAGLDTIMYSDAMAQLASIAFTLKKPEEANSHNSTSWGNSIRRIFQIDKGRNGEKAVVEVELSFGKKPFRIINVISGDLSHLGYGRGSTEVPLFSGGYSSLPNDFSSAV